MNCPRCKSPLSIESLKNLQTPMEIDVCTSCGGKWFDFGELKKLDNIIDPTFLEIRKIPKKSEQLEPLYCPSCSSHPKLEKVEHHRDSNVIFDYCSSCKGVWLDKGELEAIQTENWLITLGKIFKWIVGKD